MKKTSLLKNEDARLIYVDESISLKTKYEPIDNYYYMRAYIEGLKYEGE